MAIQTEESVETSKGLWEDISRKHLINILNYVNFKGGMVVVNLKSSLDGSRLSLRATPEPCIDHMARLVWLETPPGHIETAAYQLVDFFIDKGSRVVVVGGQVSDINRLGIMVVLPQRCYATSRRRMERFSSALVHSRLSRCESEATGLLQDFGGGCLKARFSAHDAGFLSKRNGKVPLKVALVDGKATVYNGEGLIKRRIANGEYVDLVIALTTFHGEKTSGGEELILGRDLIATCRHPLSDRIIRLRVVKASYNSFVVNEHPEHVTLFQGLIIPEMRIDFGTGDCAKCTAQVVGGEAGTWLMSVLDMPIHDQGKLFSFIEKETGMSSGVSAVIDPEDLIEFFFEAGFIYPSKYASLLHSQERLKNMLSHLYIETPSISQHFVRYDSGMIKAHISMVRFYERSWVIHHHTAIGGTGA